MPINMRTFISFLFTVACGITLAGTDPVLQAAQADFKRTNLAYEKTPNLSMDTQYMVFGDQTSDELMEAKNGKYIKFENQVYTLVDDIETYTIKDKIISINQENRLISVGDHRASAADLMPMNVDSLLTLCEKIEVEQINATEKKYKLFFSPGDLPEFNRVDIHIDTKNYRFTRLVLFYAMEINLKSDFYAEEKRPRLEIVYKNFKTLSAEPLIFNEALYIVENQGKLKPAPKYYNYKVMDLRNQTRIKTSK